MDNQEALNRLTAAAEKYNVPLENLVKGAEFLAQVSQHGYDVPSALSLLVSDIPKLLPVLFHVFPPSFDMTEYQRLDVPSPLQRRPLGNDRRDIALEQIIAGGKPPRKD